MNICRSNLCCICLFLTNILVFFLFYRRIISRDFSKLKLEHLSKSTQVDEVNVTRIIHQSWKNKTIPHIFKRYVPSWRKCFPGYQHKLWTDDDNRAFIVKHYPWFIPKYDEFPSMIFRADCARYFYMYHYGGIYTDLDNECFMPFEHLLANYSLVFGDIDVAKKILFDNKYIQNSFMYSRPNHEFWLELLAEIYFYDSEKAPDVITGPDILTGMILRYINKRPQPKDIMVYDAKYFNPLSWEYVKVNPPYCKPFNWMKEHEYQKCRKYFKEKGAYVVQYHTHVW